MAFVALSESRKGAIDWLNSGPARAADFFKKADNYIVFLEGMTSMLKTENQYDFTPKGVRSVFLLTSPISCIN